MVPTASNDSRRTGPPCLTRSSFFCFPFSVTPKRYLDLDLPEHFMLQIKTEHGEWWEQAICLAERFSRDEEGAYGCLGQGSPIIFRCVEKIDDVHFVHQDGGGDRFEYRLLKIEPDGRIPLPEGGALLPDGTVEPA